MLDKVSSYTLSGTDAPVLVLAHFRGPEPKDDKTTAIGSVTAKGWQPFYRELEGLV